jgi:hypothetical protein
MFCAFALYNSFGQVKASTIQSVFIYSAIKYMEWPEDDNSDFIIFIMGDTPVYDELLKVSKAKKAGNRNIVVRKISSPSELAKCNILFIASASANQLNKVVGSSNESMLIITESEGAIDRGSDLNFIQRGEKLTFQIGEKSLANKKIKVSAAFSTLAQK